jgi:hypothetical protein
MLTKYSFVLYLIKLQPVREEPKKEIEGKDVEMGFDITHTKHRGQVPNILLNRVDHKNSTVHVELDPELAIFSVCAPQIIPWESKAHFGSIYFTHMWSLQNLKTNSEQG